MSKPAASACRTAVQTRVTEQILAQLKQGVRPWSKPWTCNSPAVHTLPCRQNGQPYRGINVLLLWAVAQERGYTCNTWFTYRQAEALGAHVRKGEKGSFVVYVDRMTKQDDQNSEDDATQCITFMKTYTVFNAEQIDGLRLPPAPSSAEPFALLAQAESFFAATGADIRHGGNQAYYAPGPDLILLPAAQSFRDAQSYAATKAHELIHWTGHASRLARDLSGRFGGMQYAAEELVAELGSAFLCASLGIADEPREDHASYLKAWLQGLKDDHRAILAAASKAQRAADFLYTLQPTATVAA